MKPILLACVAALFLAWGWFRALSFARPRTIDFAAGDGYRGHLATERGRISLTTFASVPEDEYYREVAIPYWLVEAVLLPPAVCLAWAMRRSRGRVKGGFPVQMPEPHG